MCTGAEIAIIGLAAAGTTATVYSQVQQGKAAEAQAETEAELQRREAAAEKDAAIAQAEKIRKAQRYAIASANAANAASGVQIGEGSAGIINEQIYKDSEDDAFSTLLTGTRRQRYGEAQSGITLTQGRNAKTAGYLNATSSLLAGGASMAKGWKSSKNTTAAEG